MQIKMIKDGAWMVNGQAQLFKKNEIIEVGDELGQKIIDQGYGHSIPMTPNDDEPELVAPEDRQPKLSRKVTEKLAKK